MINFILVYYFFEEADRNMLQIKYVVQFWQSYDLARNDCDTVKIWEHSPLNASSSPPPTPLCLTSYLPAHWDSDPKPLAQAAPHTKYQTKTRKYQQAAALLLFGFRVPYQRVLEF